MQYLNYSNEVEIGGYVLYLEHDDVTGLCIAVGASYRGATYKCFRETSNLCGFW
jgi:hypothetical protein